MNTRLNLNQVVGWIAIGIGLAVLALLSLAIWTYGNLANVTVVPGF